jgi:hypothetical protein
MAIPVKSTHEIVSTILTKFRFLIEGVITGMIGIASWVMMPASPCQTKGRGRGKLGWFTEHEESVPFFE